RAPQFLAPSLELLVHGLGLVEQRLVRREIRVELAARPVRGAYLHRLETREHVEFGQEQLGETVQARRVAQDDGIEPAAVALSPRVGSELLSAFAEALAVRTVVPRRERPRANPRDVGFRDT